MTIQLPCCFMWRWEEKLVSDDSDEITPIMDPCDHTKTCLQWFHPAVVSLLVNPPPPSHNPPLPPHNPLHIILIIFTVLLLLHSCSWFGFAPPCNILSVSGRLLAYPDATSVGLHQPPMSRKGVRI